MTRATGVYVILPAFSSKNGLIESYLTGDDGLAVICELKDLKDNERPFTECESEYEDYLKSQMIKAIKVHKQRYYADKRKQLRSKTGKIYYTNIKNNLAEKDFIDNFLKTVS